MNLLIRRRLGASPLAVAAHAFNYHSNSLFLTATAGGVDWLLSI